MRNMREGKDTFDQSVDLAFLNLVERVAACHACPRMNDRTRVLSKANGNTRADVLFIAEAPGRLGADSSSVPLYGDQAGRNFQTLLDHAGIRREDVFVTNAVLCNPRDESGNNASPTTQEISNCAGNLRETIEIIQPRYIVTLGGIALKSLHLIEPHMIRLSRDVGCRIAWFNRWLVPLYHPGARARIHRSTNIQYEDFLKLAALLTE